MSKQLIHIFEDIISVDNLLSAWQEFIVGKKSKPDVLDFAARLSDNIIELHHDLATKTYQHGDYYRFCVNDPKHREISKASVRDRLVHHAIYRQLYPAFDKVFLADSFSCRLGKGTHRALDRFSLFGRQVGKNNSRACWILKGDIRKFFASIDHDILLVILQSAIVDQNIVWLLRNIIESFYDKTTNNGLPLGNLTSQLFANVYLNEFDQFVKRQLKVKFYIRYADDFAIFSNDKNYLIDIVPLLADFLTQKLRLTLHPQKLFIKTLSAGVDFLGWTHFPTHRILRRTTKKRVFRKISLNPSKATVNSYLGLLKHGNGYKIKQKIFKLLD
jgi:retron-type reverse transcriptase